jgi:hypothetical protein
MILNLTPHAIAVYAESQFVGLTQKNPTTWVASGVEGTPIAEYEAEKKSARIEVSTVPIASPLPGDTVQSVYGAATGIPESITSADILIVSLPMQSMAKAAGLPSAPQMVAPYKVVRDAGNGSIVLGCMGFTY